MLSPAVERALDDGEPVGGSKDSIDLARELAGAGYIWGIWSPSVAKLQACSKAWRASDERLVAYPIHGGGGLPLKR